MFATDATNSYMGVSYFRRVLKFRWRRKRPIFTNPMDSLVFNLFADFHNCMDKANQNKEDPLIFCWRRHWNISISLGSFVPMVK